MNQKILSCSICVCVQIQRYKCCFFLQLFYNFLSYSFTQRNIRFLRRKLQFLANFFVTKAGFLVYISLLETGRKKGSMNLFSAHNIVNSLGRNFKIIFFLISNTLLLHCVDEDGNNFLIFLLVMFSILQNEIMKNGLKSKFLVLCGNFT